MADFGHFVRAYTPNWLTQFGVYRYESADPKGRKTRSCRIGLIGLLGMFAVIVLVIFVLIENVWLHKVVPSRRDEITTENPFMINEDVVWSSNMLRNETQMVDEKGFIEKRSYGTTQKLVFLPSRHLRPPKRGTFRRRNGIEMNRRLMLKSRPFRPPISGTAPMPFKRLPSSTAGYQFHDPYAEESSDLEGTQEESPIDRMSQKVRLVGSYRRGRVKHRPSLRVRPRPTNIYQPDPFYNFKPQKPSDVNLLAVDKFRFSPKNPLSKYHRYKAFKAYQDAQIRNAQYLYNHLLAASQNQELYQAPPLSSEKNPIKLTLDLIPTGAMNTRNKRPLEVIKFNPYAAKLNELNSIHFEKAYDSSFFDNLQFAQTQQQRHPYSTRFYENTFLKKPLRFDGNHSSGQLVVHLNLFPNNSKMKSSSSSSDPMGDENDFFKRSSDELPTRNPLYDILKPEGPSSTIQPISINFNFPMTRADSEDHLISTIAPHLPNKFINIGFDSESSSDSIDFKPSFGIPQRESEWNAPDLSEDIIFHQNPHNWHWNTIRRVGKPANVENVTTTQHENKEIQ